MTLAGKVALVTGGARGIGQAIAVELARSGANIAFCDICEPELAAGTLSAIRDTGQTGRYFAPTSGIGAGINSFSAKFSASSAAWTFW